MKLMTSLLALAARHLIIWRVQKEWAGGTVSNPLIRKIISTQQNLRRSISKSHLQPFGGLSWLGSRHLGEPGADGRRFGRRGDDEAAPERRRGGRGFRRSDPSPLFTGRSERVRVRP